MDGNEKSLWKIRQILNLCKWSARACLWTELHRLHNVVSLTHSPLSSAGAESGSPFGLLPFTDPSWCHLDTHNSRVLWLGTLHLWNTWWKPWCIDVIDCFDKQFHCQCRTDQRCISTKHQTSLYMMAVSMEAVHSGHAGFQILKTVRSFWHTLYKGVQLKSKLRHSGCWLAAALLRHLALTATTFVSSYIHSCKEKFGAHLIVLLFNLCGDRGGTVVKVLCYKSEGRWFDPRWCHWNFSLT